MIEVWLYDAGPERTAIYSIPDASAPREWVVPIIPDLCLRAAAPDYEPVPEPQLDDTRYDLFGLVHKATRPTGLKADTRHRVGLYVRHGLPAPEPFEVWFGVLADVERALPHVHELALNRLRAVTPRSRAVELPVPRHLRSAAERRLR